MSYTDLLMQEYILGDRMGELEESLADSLRVDCSAKTYPAAGPVLWSDGKEMVMDTGEAHTLVISGTGGGKTVSQMMPTLRAAVKAGESLLVTDVKGGELYESAWPYLKQQGYRIWVVNLRQPLHGLRYNPLFLPFLLLRSNKAELNELGHQMLAQAADAIVTKENEKDPFWDHASKDTFLGLAYLLVLLDDPRFCHLQNICDLFTILREEPKQLRSWIEFTAARHELGKAARRLLSARLFSESSPRTSAGIDSTLAAKFNRFLGTPLQADFLGGNDLDFTHLDEERIGIFLLLPDESDIWQTHASLLVTQIYQYLCLVAAEQADGRLPHRFHFILEEFGNLNLGNSAASLFSAGRSRNIRVTAAIQNFSQLEHRYGRELADVIRYNCGNWVYLYTRDLETLRMLSELCGTRTYLQEGVTRPTASVGDLQRIPQGQALVFRQRSRPFLTRLAPVWDYPETAEDEKAAYPVRTLQGSVSLHKQQVDDCLRRLRADVR